MFEIDERPTTWSGTSSDDVTLTPPAGRRCGETAVSTVA
jgi:hypothetical protein